mmetsp:Transcript_32145/g.57559  ORF Transcript_32145/g.57559 Transcript_32145/m.57559 type:complete len:211 (-) Transcript_32145:124-756(-)
MACTATTSISACVVSSAVRRNGGAAAAAPSRMALGSHFATGSVARLAGAPLVARRQSTVGATATRRVTAMASKVTRVIKIALPAGKANPAPPVGPALGSAGVNIMAFCKEYNAATQDKAGMIIPCEISVYEDRSFTFVLKTPPASVLIMKAAGIEKGAGESAKGSIGTITEAQLKEIAEIKMPDLNSITVESAMKVVQGTARNMGVTIEG